MTRLIRWNQRLARWYRLACWAGLMALAGTALLLLADFAWPGLLDRAGADEGVGALSIALIIATFVLVVPAVLALCSSAYLLTSLACGEEWSGRDLAWGGVAVMVCAIGLAFAVGHSQCAAPTAAPSAATPMTRVDTAPASGSSATSRQPMSSAACWSQSRWFVVDQSMQGALGDIPDIWEWGFSSIELEQVTDWNRFQTLQFRLLCAVVLAGAAVAALSRPVSRISGSRLASRWHRVATTAFRWAGWAAAASALSWVAIFAIEAGIAPGWLDRVEQSQGVAAGIVQALLAITLVAVPAGLPLFTLAFLVTSLLTGHIFRKSELAVAALATLLCVGSMMHAVEASACTGSADAKAACSAAIGGYALDQFYKGAFADIFDVYDLKFGPIATDSLSFVDRVLVLNVRMLSAVLVVGVLALFAQRRGARQEVDDFAPTQADESEFSGFPATQILIDDRLVPKSRKAAAATRRS